MARITKRRIRWKGSPAPNVVSYKLYWSLRGDVNYDSKFVEVGRRTEIILPDDIVSFPLASCDVEFGVTTVNDIGNESDMTKVTATLNFAAPDPPTNVVIEALEESLSLTEDDLIQAAKTFF